MSILAVFIFFYTGMGNLYAYTYTYNNRTDYLIKVTVRFYGDVDKTSQIKANESYIISTKFLLKSWTAEAFLDNEWQQILDLTCDFLLGNHTFFIYVREVQDANGVASRSWIATSGDTRQEVK
jgi:hypothetical protein